MTVRILIADNHELVRSVIANLIREAGWKVCGIASDGKSTVEKALELKPDLLIIDHRMPDRDGISVGHEIRSLLPDIPILLCTLFASPSLENEAKNSGFQGVVQKSDGAALIAVIRSTLGLGPNDQLD